MKDTFKLTREENVFLAKKRWAESIYSGMRMESRNVTFPQTETILNGINVPGVALDDIQAILNMRDAWKYLLGHLDEDLNIDYLCNLQERVACREALAWGELRTGPIGINGMNYIPPIPETDKVEQELAGILKTKVSSSERALDVFAWIARSQLFWDGNKRTALLAANKILIECGAGIFIVPDKNMLEFSIKLSSFYETNDPSELKSFLYSTSIVDISAAPLNTKQAEESRDQDTFPTIKRRTPAWLKQKRKLAHLTQKELAKAISIAPNSIANIEQGQRKGSAEVWTKIERYFNTF